MRPQLLALTVLAFGATTLGTRSAEAQFSIVGAVAAVGGGVAAGIGNGMKAVQGLPPDEMWGEAGLLVGTLDLAVGAGFTIDYATRDPATREDWMLPVGIGLIGIGVGALTMSIWAMSNQSSGAWYEEEGDDGFLDKRWNISPALLPDGAGGVGYGVSFGMTGVDLGLP